MKEELKAAYEAGVASVEHNRKRDKLLEEGTKQCPSEATFEMWYALKDGDKEINRDPMALRLLKDFSDVMKSNRVPFDTLQLILSAGTFNQWKADLIKAEWTFEDKDHFISFRFFGIKFVIHNEERSHNANIFAESTKKGEKLMSELREKGIVATTRHDYVHTLKTRALQIASKTRQSTDFGETEHTAESLIEASRKIFQEIVKPVYRDGTPVEE